jgi:hypothetical protein
MSSSPSSTPDRLRRGRPGGRPRLLLPQERGGAAGAGPAAVRRRAAGEAKASPDHHARPGPQRNLGGGLIPRGPETQIYSIENSDLSLVATAEITLAGCYAADLDEEQLPIKLCGISHCFRTEAGAAGRASRGLYRVHQFTKVEMFAFTTPEQSDEMLDTSGPGMPHLRQPGDSLPRDRHGTGDLGGPAYRKFDLEAWMPGPRRGRRIWRGDQHLQLHRLPGPPPRHPLQKEGRKGDPLRPHAQRHRGGHQPGADRHSRKLPAGVPPLACASGQTPNCTMTIRR